MAHYVVRVARHAGIVLLFLLAALAGAASGVLFAYAGDLPQISALDDYAPNTITRLLSRNGEVIGEFATERRVVIGYDGIAPRLRQAIVAAEDADFDRHVGVNATRIVITAIQDVLKRRRAGGSTITQQLAKNLFLTPEKTFERKIKEALLAIQIEKRFTKREIFTFYCNQIYLGHGAYGVEAAARLYFGKTARTLSLDEAALIAGIIQLPERQSPFVDVTRATRRRNYVLQRMADEGFLARPDANAAKARPIALGGRQPNEPSVAPYLVEEVRKYLERSYGARRLYESGLTVGTTLDVSLQRAANRALADGLRRLDKRHSGFRKAARNVVAEGQRVDAFAHPRWGLPIAVGDQVPAVVEIVAGERGAAWRPAGDDCDLRIAPGGALVRAGEFRAELKRDGFAWTRRRSASDLVRVGDLIEVRIVSIDRARKRAEVTLDQQPEVDGAVVVLDNRTGQVLAMVGGLDFDRSKWNRATQAYRQMGSVFKPIVYAAAIDRGFTPVSMLDDSPVSYPAGPNQRPYEPHNYDGTFAGRITLREALERSRNVPAVRVTEQLGPRQVIEFARRFGLTGQMDPYLSLALGTASATLVEVTAAYSVFPNQGVLMRPYSIVAVRDRDGNLLEESRPEPRDAIRADTAYVMTSLLAGVATRGTGAAAVSLGWTIGGKTGTTNDFTDAWFIGFDPSITVGVWVGYNDRKALGPSETGAQAALPIWMDVMRAWIARQPAGAMPPAFDAPVNIVSFAVDWSTGRPVLPGTPGSIPEVFIAGTEPGGVPGK